jgi:hypothetical protein
VRFHNAGLHVIGRILSAYGCSPAEFFCAGGKDGTLFNETTDSNIRRLEQAARTLRWPAADYFELKTEYLKERAGKDSSVVLSQEHWRERHNALEAI